MKFEDTLILSEKLLEVGFFLKTDDVLSLIKTAESFCKEPIEFYFNVNSEEETWEFDLDEIDIFIKVLSRLKDVKDPWLRYSNLPYADPELVLSIPSGFRRVF